MEELKRLIESDPDFEPYGAVSEDAIRQVEHALGADLPPSYRWFVKSFGGGGVAGGEFSGILDDDPLSLGGHLVYGDTMLFRESHKLSPEYLVVKRNDELGALWCLDTRRRDPDGECPIVRFDLLRGSTPQEEFHSFHDFLAHYLTPDAD